MLDRASWTGHQGQLQGRRRQMGMPTLSPGPCPCPCPAPIKINSVGRRRDPTITCRFAQLPTKSQWWAHAIQLRAHLPLEIPQGGRSHSCCTCCDAPGAGGCLGPGAVLLASRLQGQAGPSQTMTWQCPVCFVVLYCMEISAVLLCVVSPIQLASSGDSPQAPASAGLGPRTAAPLSAEQCRKVLDLGATLRLRSWKVCRRQTSPPGLPGASYLPQAAQHLRHRGEGMSGWVWWGESSGVFMVGGGGLGLFNCF